MPPDQVAARLIAIVPEFADYWNSDRACFRDADGAFTCCGAFADCSIYVRDHYDKLTANQKRQLSTFMSECFASGGDLADAAATCFLENLTYEPFSDDLESYLRGEALGFYRDFQGK